MITTTNIRGHQSEAFVARTARVHPHLVAEAAAVPVVEAVTGTYLGAELELGGMRGPGFAKGDVVAHDGSGNYHHR